MRIVINTQLFKLDTRTEMSMYLPHLRPYLHTCSHFKYTPLIYLILHFEIFTIIIYSLLFVIEEKKKNMHSFGIEFLIISSFLWFYFYFW